MPLSSSAASKDDVPSIDTAPVSTGSPPRRSRPLLLVLVVVLAFALGAVSYRLLTGGAAGLQSPLAVGPTVGGGACSAPSSATLQDTVEDDEDYEGLWPHTPGQRITVYFAYGTLPARYANFVKTGAQLWSRSPCVNAVAVPACPSGGNCSNVTVEPRAEDDSDGNSDSVDRKGVRRSNTLTLYTDYQDKATDSGALATTVHEMGHALGLMHRNNKQSVMYEDTINMTNAVPDPVDYQNLIALYGGGHPPGISDGD